MRQSKAAERSFSIILGAFGGFSVVFAGSLLFEGLNIWREEVYRSLQGTYPVISLSFADVKDTSYEEARIKICQTIVDLYNKYAFLAKGD